jgi:hypothetical protein
MPVHDYLRSRYGFNLSADDRTVTVTAPLTQVLYNNPRRVGWTVCNRSPYPISLSFKWETPFGEGLLVPGNGGVVSMVLEEDGEAVFYPVFARLETGTATLWVYEVVEV